MDSDIASMDVQALAKAGWKVVFVDSFEAGEGEKVHAIDGKPDTFWHTQWSGGAKRPPHEIQIDLGPLQKLAGFTCLPRQNQDNGRIAKFEFFVQHRRQGLGQAGGTGRVPQFDSPKRSHFPQSVEGRFIRLVALSEVRDREWTTVAELDVVLDKITYFIILRIGQKHNQHKQEINTMKAGFCGLSLMLAILAASCSQATATNDGADFGTQDGRDFFG